MLFVCSIFSHFSVHFIFPFYVCVFVPPLHTQSNYYNDRYIYFEMSNSNKTYKSCASWSGIHKHLATRCIIEKTNLFPCEWLFLITTHITAQFKPLSLIFSIVKSYICNMSRVCSMQAFYGSVVMVASH